MTTSQLMIEAADRLEFLARRQWTRPYLPDFCTICNWNAPIHAPDCLISSLRAASQQEMQLPDEYEMREWWRGAGGSFYGPNVEHADIEERKFFKFVHWLMDKARRA